MKPLDARSLSLAVACSLDTATRWVTPLQNAMDAFAIDTRDRQAMFLAQIGVESAHLSRGEEDLNYTAARLVEVFPHRFPTMAAAKPFAGQPERLANTLYANRMGNGDIASGDGYRYRGRGLIQLTGKANYIACGEGIGLDLIERPELLTEPTTAALSAAWFWHDRQLNALADVGNLTAITRLINGGLTGLAERQARLATARQALTP